MVDSAEAPPRVLVVGAGAIGAFYGGQLARAGAQVSVVSRADFEAVQSVGYDIRSPLGDFVFRPAQVLRSAADCPVPPDYLLLCVKTVRGLDRAALIRDAVGPHTVIVLIANGIGVEQELADAFPHNELVSVLAYVAVSRTGRGTVQHHALGALAMGNFPRGVTARTERLAGLFRAAGLSCETQDDIAASRWHKCLWNIAFNPISVLGGALDTRAILAPPEGEAFVRRVMQEMCRVAAANGYPMDEQVIEGSIRSTRAMTPYKTSMALDYENGRALEIDPIIGNVVRSARRHGVAVPSLEALHALLCMVQDRAEAPAPG
ncbi:ketopantoate reductase family protein [Variovorax terrae]|uniref:2-dehydropantoate 2-reductase n=1 Tax=Variovorax terrae TaxID=2923278 RepID=A0A9X1VW52_9BURK|nr:2-dehydropantoate 2-reductase [Variovorax terrae]MCJ0764349.1 2-dehydropantoate 2-reductase [Variovorax terrae]